jgi:hypothetical protein
LFPLTVVLVARVAVQVNSLTAVVVRELPHKALLEVLVQRVTTLVAAVVLALWVRLRMWVAMAVVMVAQEYHHP